VVTHAFAAGSYQVKLTVTKPGSGAGCFSGICASEVTKTVVVGTGGGGTLLDPAFEANAECINIGGFDQCQAQTGVEVTLNALSTTATTFAWDFGDGTTGSGKSITHFWTSPGPYTVKLTVGDGTTTAMKTRLFQVSGDVISGANSVVLPWIAQTRGALVQSSDLYVHNPGSTAIEVALEFRKRGNPEANPPRVTRELKAGETLFFADVLRELFDRENIAGFISVEVLQGNVEPVITSFNTTFQGDAKFGQTIPGVSMSRRGAAATAVGPTLQHLVGLNDTDERSSYFGVSNPSGGPVTYRLRFYDKDGEEIGTSKVYTLSRYGQKQFQPREIREELGVADVDDYRVQVETVSGGPIFPYGANIRNASEDPSFVGVGTTASSKLYLIGALSTPGLQGSRWQSDVVLSNTSDKVILTDMTFLRVGFNSQPEQTVKVTLQPGETRRLVDVVADEWGIDDAVGMLIFDSDSQSAVFPVVQGESYDNSHPARRFGQSMAAFTDASAAGPGQGHYLAGLRQEADYRTTLWLYNPSDQAGLYDLVYRKLDGTVLGRLDGVTLGAGKAKQVRPSDHPIPTGRIADGFTVQVLVRTGKVLAAGQVVNNATNDPAYISGEKR
jgi:PKD repeat protein